MRLVCKSLKITCIEIYLLSDFSSFRMNYVSENNEAIVRFHSDYSVSGGGFSLTWHSVDVSGCPLQTLTAKEGVITSPNYPYFLLSHLDCSTTILAPGNYHKILMIQFCQCLL